MIHQRSLRRTSAWLSCRYSNRASASGRKRIRKGSARPLAPAVSSHRLAVPMRLSIGERTRRNACIQSAGHLPRVHLHFAARFGSVAVLRADRRLLHADRPDAAPAPEERP